MVEKLSHRKTLLSFETERKVLEVLQADCSQPAAAYSVIEPAGIEKEKILLTVMYGGKESRGEWGWKSGMPWLMFLSARRGGMSDGKEINGEKNNRKEINRKKNKG